MPILLAVILGLVQGITEFLPISSSGHLVVFQHYLEPVFGAGETPLAFDVLVHLATLLVTAAYLRDEIFQLVSTFFQKTEAGKRAREFTLLVFIGTLPAVLLVLGVGDYLEEVFSSVTVAANGFILTAIFLEVAHRRQAARQSTADCSTERLTEPLAWVLPTKTQALLIGLAQAIAIAPGVSRSGSTIAAALILGLSSQSAVRFSFYLLLPAVLGATVLELPKIVAFGTQSLPAYSLGFITTAFVGWLSLHWLVKIVDGAKLRYFAVYVLLLSALLRL